MNNKLIRIIMSFLAALLLCGLFAGTALAEPESSDADSAVGAQVTVGTSRIKVRISRVGNSGTAQLYRFAANEYYKADPLTGLSENTAAAGTLIGTYDCGSTQEFSFNRYRDDGSDILYDKYYLVQNGKILVGPFYATEISSMRSTPPFTATTKKGIIHEDSTTPALAAEMGVGNTDINMDIASLIYRNEDKDGKPVDNSKLTDIIEFESNGETFYINASYIKSVDGEVSAYSKMGINVTFTVIAWQKSDLSRYPSSLMYTDGNHQTMGFNTSNDRGLKYWIAAMEFLADRYSRSSQIGLVNKFVIGNEIDYTYDWYLILPERDAEGKFNHASLDVFMEEYARTFRMANLAVKKYNSESKVIITLTHNWADSRATAFTTPLTATGSSRMYNSYAPKQILDWMNTVEKSRGDYDWGITVHPYPIGTSSSRPNVTDFNYPGVKPVNGNWRTSPWITCVNLELYQQYMERPAAMYKGELREMIITEASVCNVDKKTVREDVYQTALREQAATIAMYYYRAANLPCFTEVTYFMPHDQDTDLKYQLGLMEVDGTRKPSFNVWKYIDTDLTFNYSNRYLKYIDPDASSYYDLMDLSHSGFDWKTAWSEDNIITRHLSSSDVERSVSTDKQSYASDEPILVTAVGAEGDLVCLFKATDNVYLAEPIYSFPLNVTSGAVSCRSGRTYDILAYGEISYDRIGEAGLTAGSYLVAVRRGDNGQCVSTPITLLSDYTVGDTDTRILLDRMEYAAGENIIVTAAHAGEKAWVGLYKKSDNPGSVSSIYWYWVNDPSVGAIPGKPVVLQSGTHNTDSSNPSNILSAGDYTVYLFADGGYSSVAAKQSFKVTGSSAFLPLESVKYTLSSDTDGLANGMVTVTKAEDNLEATDCVMFWADENGAPLEGYTALAMFKLTGPVTRHKMYTHTFIPEGAKKLIAYASNGVVMSEEYVSADLPEDCGYSFENGPLAEFQIISDVHVTTDSGAKGEVRLSNQHFRQMLEDVKAYSPDSLGIFINGDIANTGAEAEFLKVYDMYQKSRLAGGGSLPYIHMSIGNHDWMAGNPDGQFQKYAKIFNPTLPAQPEDVYYDEVVGGYHFIYLGGEQPGLSAVLSQKQLTWLDGRLAEYTAEDPDKPIFLFLHQSFYNTVAGSLPGQGWDGVSNEGALKRVLSKYGNIILVNGHSHWELNSESCMYPGDEEHPVALNTAAVGYLWSSYNVTAGEFASGSHGYYVRVYDDKVVFLGRDFENSLWIPSACFVLVTEDVGVDKNELNVALGSEAINLNDGNTSVERRYDSADNNVVSVTLDGTLIPHMQGTAEIVITAFGTETTTMARRRIRVNVTDIDVERVSGESRFDTGMQVAEQLRLRMGVDQFDAVVLACGRNFADALAGSYLAAKKDAPVLITADRFGGSAPYEEINAYIRKNVRSGGTVYVLGGEAAVPAVCLTGLEGYNIVRLAGADRYETNILILNEAGVEPGEEVIVCTGKTFADSLSASALGKPILLVSGALRESQKSFLEGLSNGRFYILGGTNAVGEELALELTSYGATERIAGKTRFETSVAIAEKFIEAPEAIVIAYSHEFPDGLCGSQLARVLGAPVILTRASSEDAAAAYREKYSVSSGIILGGDKRISPSSASKIFGYDISTER